MVSKGNMTEEKPKIGSQTKAVTEGKMRAVIIKIIIDSRATVCDIRWHMRTMLVFENCFIKPCRHNNTDDALQVQIGRDHSNKEPSRVSF